MGNTRRPGAPAVDLAAFAARARFEQLTSHYGDRSRKLQALGLNTDVVLLTARFEVLLATLANAAGIDPEVLMLDVEEQSVGRALERFDQIEPALLDARAQHDREGL